MQRRATYRRRERLSLEKHAICFDVSKSIDIYLLFYLACSTPFPFDPTAIDVPLVIRPPTPVLRMKAAFLRVSLQ